MSLDRFYHSPSGGLLFGIVVGIFLTWLGGLHQNYLNKQYDMRKRSDELALRIALNLNSRMSLCRNTLLNSGSSQFDERWDHYIYEGFLPWDKEHALMMRFVETRMPEVKEDFDLLDTKFRQMHQLLVKIRRYQGSKTKERLWERNKLEAQIAKICQELEPVVNRLNDRLVTFRQEKSGY